MEAVKNVSLIVDPPTVRRFEHATLRCFYDLQNAPLYSVKFYRGLREFYRFSPTEIPNKKIFAFPGINVDVSTKFCGSFNVKIMFILILCVF